MKKPKNLVLPESIVLEIMALTSRLGEIAVDYNKKIGGEETESLVRLYTKVVKRLMNLEYEDLNYKRDVGMDLDEILESLDLTRPPRGDNNGNH